MGVISRFSKEGPLSNFQVHRIILFLTPTHPILVVLFFPSFFPFDKTKREKGGKQKPKEGGEDRREKREEERGSRKRGKADISSSQEMPVLWGRLRI